MADFHDFLQPKDFVVTMDFSLREITFKWSKSPVTPDSRSLSPLQHKLHHQTVAAAPCTTTIHQHHCHLYPLACTNVPTDASMCTFSIESVVCGKVVNLFNDTIHNPMNLNPMNMTDTSSCDYGVNVAIASTSLLAYNIGSKVDLECTI